MADWEWFFASEYGRDRILKDRLTDLQYQASSAASSSARLSSQLAHLQGSVENRLTALSAAFDAYVELGDVRESLAVYADQTELRARATAVVRQLSDAESAGAAAPGPLDDPDRTGYWLVPATNALIATVTGGRDHGAEAAARAADPESDLFLVAAAGAFDRGAAVADLVPDLFAGRDRLDGSRVLVLRAVLAGHYGPLRPDLLPALRGGWGTLLGDTADAGWAEWVLAETRTADRTAQLRWLQLQLAAAGTTTEGEAGGAELPAARRGPDFAAPDPVPSPQPTGGPARASDAAMTEPQRELRDELRGIVVEMISAGTGPEAELLSRARVLRARIENPQQARALEEQTAGTGTPTLEVIRAQVLAAEPGSAARTELFAWMRPALTGLVSAWAAEPVTTEPARREARTPGGTVPVTAAGPDPSRLSAAQATASTENPYQTRRLTGFGIAGAVLLVLAAVVAFTSLTALAVLALIGAIVCGVVALLAYRTRAAERRQREDDLRRLEDVVQKAVAEVRAIDDATRATQAERSDLTTRVHAALAG